MCALYVCYIILHNIIFLKPLFFFLQLKKRPIFILKIAVFKLNGRYFVKNQYFKNRLR